MHIFKTLKINVSTKKKTLQNGSTNANLQEPEGYRTQTRPVLSCCDSTVAVTDYASKCLKPNSAAIPEEQGTEQIKTRYGQINTKRNSVQME